MMTLATLVGFLGTPIAAQTITDGNTLELNGRTYHLCELDAPKAKKGCPDRWPAV